MINDMDYIVCSNDVLGHTATVFGATGFLGRYIVNRLGTT